MFPMNQIVGTFQQFIENIEAITNLSIVNETMTSQSSHIFVFCRKTSVQGTQACFSGLMIFFLP